MKDLIKRIIDTCNYNEMSVDIEMSIEYACMIAQDFTSKDATAVSEDIIHPLMQQFSDTNDLNEQSYIRDTITMIVEYISKF